MEQSGNLIQFEQVMRANTGKPLRDWVGALAAALGETWLLVPVQESGDETSNQLMLLVGNDKDGKPWAYAYTSEKEFAKTLPPGSAQPSYQRSQLPGLMTLAERAGLAGILLNSGSTWAYPLFKEHFPLARAGGGPKNVDSEHNRLYVQGTGLIRPYMEIHGQQTKPLDNAGRESLRQGIELLKRALSINSNNWAAMWIIGKAHQRLEDFASALQFFDRADKAHPGHPDVNREASLAAMELGRPEDAIPYCRSAIAAKPDEPGLRANLALALLFSGQVAEADAIAREALRRDRSDQITRRIMKLCADVASGRRACPRHRREI